MKNTLPALIFAIAALLFIPTLANAQAWPTTAATGTNVINNGNYQQTWQWRSLTNSDGLVLSTDSAQQANGIQLLAVEPSGALSNTGVTTTAIYGYNSNSGTTSTDISILGKVSGNGTQNYGVEGLIQSTGHSGDAAIWGNAGSTTGTTYAVYGTNASAAGYAGYFNNTGGGYSAAFMGGNVGIGTATPAGKLDINTGASSDVVFGQDASFTTYNAVSLNGTLTDAGNMGMFGGASGDPSLYIQAPSAGGIYFRTNGNTACRGDELRS